MSDKPITNPSKLVAVVIPLSDRTFFTDEEKISIRHLTNHLGKYDKILVAPEGNQPDLPGFHVKNFPHDNFGSMAAHNRLIMSRAFYEAFADYKFILNYHLDALVFSDQLKEWCERDYDYIGAPWIKHKDASYTGFAGQEGKVGNGGFSLRKVESFLQVLYSRKLSFEPADYWRKHYGGLSFLQKAVIKFPKMVIKKTGILNNVSWEISWLQKKQNEEYFWVNRAPHYFPPFNIAPLEEALLFSFESFPRDCFELSGKVLPFGCHAWQKYDRAFWEPHLLPEGEL